MSAPTKDAPHALSCSCCRAHRDSSGRVVRARCNACGTAKPQLGTAAHNAWCTNGRCGSCCAAKCTHITREGW